MTIKKFKAIKARGVSTYSIKGRSSKVGVEDFARTPGKGSTTAEFLDSLPNILGARDLSKVAEAAVKAHKGGHTVSIGIGGHVIKTGLGPIIIDLMERGIVNSVSMNGSCVVHDFEVAYAGVTSEDVEREINSGKFGMAKETGQILNGAINKGAELGLGRAVGEMIDRGSGKRFPHKDKSILAAAARLGVPATVHVALGTDILHVHPSFKGDRTGLATSRDFDLLTGVVATLEGGVYINIGSAVVLPEVFLKALTLARNLGHKVTRFTTVNMDFIQHYRPTQNVVRRPTQLGGRGYSLTGHHEIMVPLLYASIIERV